MSTSCRKSTEVSAAGPKVCSCFWLCWNWDWDEHLGNGPGFLVSEYRFTQEFVVQVVKPEVDLDKRQTLF
jgi:hypothetical protein